MGAERLSYSEFQRQFLVYAAILTSADFDKEIAVEEVSAMIEGKFPSSYPHAAAKELMDSRRLAGFETLSDQKIKLTPTGLEFAEEYATRLGIDLDEAIDEHEAAKANDFADVDAAPLAAELKRLERRLSSAPDEVRVIVFHDDEYRQLIETLKAAIKTVRANNELMDDSEGSRRVAELEAGHALLQGKEADVSLTRRLVLDPLAWLAKKIGTETVNTAAKTAVTWFFKWLGMS